jgi:hypothetical protein
MICTNMPVEPSIAPVSIPVIVSNTMFNLCVRSNKNL